jgi:hypothetical protein
MTQFKEDPAETALPDPNAEKKKRVKKKCWNGCAHFALCWRL